MASIKCGNCKATHGSAAEVRECYGVGLPTQEPLEPTWGEVFAAFDPDLDGQGNEGLAHCQERISPVGKAPATEKQIAFVRSLLEDRQHEYADASHAVWEEVFASKEATSKIISDLVSKPKAQADRTSHHPPATPLEDGIYAKDGNFILVYHTVHGMNVQVAKFLIIREEADGFSGEWDYQGKKGLAGLSASHKLSQEEAAEFGKVYGICVRCARTLTADESKYVGYGSTCAGHEGWFYPTKAQLKELQKISA